MTLNSVHMAVIFRYYTEFVYVTSQLKAARYTRYPSSVSRLQRWWRYQLRVSLTARRVGWCQGRRWKFVAGGSKV